MNGSEELPPIMADQRPNCLALQKCRTRWVEHPLRQRAGCAFESLDFDLDQIEGRFLPQRSIA
jgi:hypothetical protein